MSLTTQIILIQAHDHSSLPQLNSSEDQLTSKRDVFIVFFEVSWNCFRFQTWRVFNYAFGVIFVSLPITGNYFSCLFCLQRLLRLPNEIINKMRTNYACQIYIVKQFIIGSMSLGIVETLNSPETRLNWWFNNIFLSFCVFFSRHFFCTSPTAAVFN